MIPEKYRTFTSTEVCEILHVSKVTLWEWQKKGLLIPKKVGKQNLYLESQIKAILEIKG